MEELLVRLSAGTSVRLSIGCRQGGVGGQVVPCTACVLRARVCGNKVEGECCLGGDKKVKVQICMLCIDAVSPAHTDAVSPRQNQVGQYQQAGRPRQQPSTAGSQQPPARPASRCPP
jgi:hypothetical protein